MSERIYYVEMICTSDQMTTLGAEVLCASSEERGLMGLGGAKRGEVVLGGGGVDILDLR